MSLRIAYQAFQPRPTVRTQHDQSDMELIQQVIVDPILHSLERIKSILQANLGQMINNVDQVMSTTGLNNILPVRVFPSQQLSTLYEEVIGSVYPLTII